MTKHQAGKAALQRFHVKWSADMERGLKVVGDVRYIKLLQKPDSFLRTSQRNLVAARYRPYN